MVTCLLQLVLSAAVMGISHSGADTIYREQIVLHLDKPYYLTGETLWYKAYSINQNGQLSNLSAVLYLELFDHQQQRLIQISTSLESGTGNGQIPISSAWSTGNYTLRAYTAWMRNFGPESFAYQSVKVFNPLSVLTASIGPGGTYQSNNSTPSENEDYLKISTDKTVYTPRQPVKVSVSSNLPDSKLSNLSVSVYPYHRSLEPNTKETTLAGKSLQHPDNLMYYPERVGPIFYGTIDNELVPQQDLLVSTGGEGVRVYEPIPVSDNRFALQISKKVSHDYLYITNPGNQEFQVTIDSVFDTRRINFVNRDLSLDSSAISFIENQSVNMQISNLYQEFTDIHGRSVSGNLSQDPFYGLPDFHYKLDDYTRFPDLHEVFTEFIKYVAPRTRDGSLKMYVWDYYSNEQSLANNIFFDQAALVLLDGLPVHDVGLLMEVDPLRIESIDVITKSYHVGSKVFHGIVALKSYKQDFDGTESFFKLGKLATTVLAQHREFNHPNYEDETVEGRIPDRRNTLYWNPNIEIQDQEMPLTFYTGDAEGTYQILIRGFAESGEPIRQTKLFTVQSTSTP